MAQAREGAFIKQGRQASPELLAASWDGDAMITAAAALLNPAIRRIIADVSGCHDETVKRYLRGYPPGNAAKAAALEEVARDAGVDLATLPVRSSEEVAEHRRARAPKCKRCRELDEPRISRLVESIQAERAESGRLRERVAELEAALAARQTQPAQASEAIAPKPVPIRQPKERASEREPSALGTIRARLG